VAVNVLLPQLDDLHDTGAVIRRARWAWLAVALALLGLSYAFAAVAQLGVSPVPIPFARVAAVQVGTSFTNRLLPGGLGGAVLNERMLERAGVERATAASLVAVKTLEGAVGHALLAVLALGLVDRTRFFRSPLPGGWGVLVAVVVGFAAVGLVLSSPFGRAGALLPARRTMRSVLGVVLTPRRATQLVLGNVGVTLCLVAAMAGALHAVGGRIGFVTVAATYLAATAVASTAPTPGNVGAVEAALVAGFTAAGVTGERAVAAVLTFRLVTFWLPILPGWLAYSYLRRRGAV
jgi:undecaprenyl-diphosphatase